MLKVKRQILRSNWFLRAESPTYLCLGQAYLNQHINLGVKPKHRKIMANPKTW